MDHSSKHHSLRSFKVSEIENKASCELQENTLEYFKCEFSEVSVTEEKKKLEGSSHLLKDLQSHIISSKDGVKDLNFAFAQKIEECEIADEMLEKFQSKLITPETLLDTSIKENRIINKNPQNGMLISDETSVENYVQKTETSVKEDKLLRSMDKPQLEIQNKDDGKLDNKDGMSINLEIPKTDTLQDVSLEKTDTVTVTTELKMSDSKRKRKKTKFVCPRKKKQENDDKNTMDKSIDEENSSKETCKAKDQSEIKKLNKIEQTSQEKNDIMKKENICSKKNSVESKMNEEVEKKEQKNKNKKAVAYNDNIFSDFFETNIPLIGTKVIQNDEKPFNSRYDLAIEKNKKRFRFLKQQELYFKNGNSKSWETEAKRSEKENKNSVSRKKRENLKMAHDVTKICIQILQLLNDDTVNEKRIAKFFIKFISAPITPTSLLYVPHFVHTISLCRGSRCFSKQFRLILNECYQKCHAMFPVPLGSNFESVYTAHVQKFLPDSFDRFEDIVLDYGDISDIVESSDDERKEA